MKKKRTWKRPAHGGGHLENKKQTPAEFSKTKQYFASAKAMWETLFAKPLNKYESQ
jgi:hypothetical protein